MPVPQEWDLTGKAAIVTADRRGWTPFLASTLAEAGAAVAVAGSPGASDMDEAAEAVRDRGAKVLSIGTDVTSPSSVESMVERTVSEFGRVDILINNARVEFGKPFVDVTDDEWRAVMDFNVTSMFLCCRAAGRRMLDQGGGRIVNISSGLAVRGLWNSAVSCASQGAVHQLTSALALEFALHNIRVNAIGAGWLTTEPRSEDDEKELLVRYLPSRRKGHPTDLCGLLVYLASDACDFVTGQTVFIDGGALAHA
ncbi:MAG: SDR family oxidoreductase [SAR202 cluster bacterium]|jgi:NAD(P)-dependent dehydrogenase (short-subunit alcohol dehydrogenase family)|nr:SDR family oxidoreductase [SAR202 cluster bacterium]